MHSTAYKHNQQLFTKQQILEKLKHYCVYQQRCNSEIKEKLYSFSLTKPEVQKILLELSEHGYVNEEKFAIAYVSGKFKLKHWGKVKIKNALRQKIIDNYINKAINTINKNEYQKTFFIMADKKLQTLLFEKNTFVKKRKLTDYLLQKGFETELIKEYIKSI